MQKHVSVNWCLLVQDGRKVGHAFSQPDLMIAATAANYGLAVVTREVSEFQRAKVQFVNPWDAPQ